MIYFDSNYLVRLYLDEPGSDPVRALSQTDQVACSLHGRTEAIAAFHRAFREKRLVRLDFLEVLDQFSDEEKTAITWLEVQVGSFRRAEKAYREAGPTTFLRAADAMHLACATENGFREIYSNDKNLLKAAPLFGLKARNVIV